MMSKFNEGLSLEELLKLLDALPEDMECFKRLGYLSEDYYDDYKAQYELFVEINENRDNYSKADKGKVLEDLVQLLFKATGGYYEVYANVRNGSNEIDLILNIVTATRKYGVPFVSKIMSAGLEGWQKKGIPLSIAAEYEDAEDKAAKRKELKERYPGCETTINFLCCCNSAGEPRPNIQLVINSSKYMRDFIAEYPPDFQISARCCDYCKKQVAHRAQKYYDMIITGERRDEGGMRSVPRKDSSSMCFTETGDGKYRLRPLYYVSDSDKAWYKDFYGIKYSDAYEVYGLTRTGCCGCPISYKAVEDLEKIRPYEPNVVKAAWNIFGKSYEYRQKYNAYKEERKRHEEEEAKDVEGQMSFKDFPEIMPDK